MATERVVGDWSLASAAFPGSERHAVLREHHHTELTASDYSVKGRSGGKVIPHW